jgi:hypothetical protein
MLAPRLEVRELRLNGVPLNDRVTRRMVRGAILDWASDVENTAVSVDYLAGGLAFRVDFRQHLAFIATFSTRSRAADQGLGLMQCVDLKEAFCSPMNVVAYADKDKCVNDWSSLRRLLE